MVDKYIPTEKLLICHRRWPSFWCDAPTLSSSTASPCVHRIWSGALVATNRIFDSKKRYGHIITPKHRPRGCGYALNLYSNGGEKWCHCPRMGWIESQPHPSLDRPSKVEDVENYGLSRPLSPITCRIKAKVYQTSWQVSSIYPCLHEYDSVIYAETVTSPGMKSLWNLIRNLSKYPAEFQAEQKDDGDDNLFDIHYELESVQVDEINYALHPDFDSKVWFSRKKMVHRPSDKGNRNCW